MRMFRVMLGYVAIVVAPVTEPREAHFIVRVRDKGTPSLTAMRA